MIVYQLIQSFIFHRIATKAMTPQILIEKEDVVSNVSTMEGRNTTTKKRTRKTGGARDLVSPVKQSLSPEIVCISSDDEQENTISAVQFLNPGITLI